MIIYGRLITFSITLPFTIAKMSAQKRKVPIGNFERRVKARRASTPDEEESQGSSSSNEDVPSHEGSLVGDSESSDEVCVHIFLIYIL